ncbi:uncharacterized protein LOC115621972 [Scaptodrosophila lebanonensis]|uniref:Uncharacterized protein LOC115621972 n=1 Tax=Drosophila lebanonensis TaxID=7225 RepID=A0A6J2T9Q9_DROLE|nr:uncharacterized protein LOC115621972 [Scaptodrosophila lebanonensis]
MCRAYLLFCLLGFALCLAEAQSKDDECVQQPTLYCRGARALRIMLRNLNKSDKPLVIMRGLEIVPLHNETETEAMLKHAADTQPTLLDSVAFYLRTHEINLKLADLLDEPTTSLERNSIDEGRKKDKGQGVLLAVALMFGKMMAVMGLGGIGALALKALGVAMMALMMAGILGLKTAAQHGHETSHTVSYLTGEGHHHRRRRRRRSAGTTQVVITEGQRPLAATLPYSAWLQH